MDGKIELIDHTLGWIAKKQVENTDYRSLLTRIGKYPIAMLDFPSCGGKLGSLLCHFYPVRVEVSPQKEDLIRAYTCEFSHIALTWRHGQEDAQALKDMISVASGLFEGIFLKLLNASELPEDIILQYLDFVRENHLSGLIYCDKESVLEPQTAFDRLLRLRERASCKLEFCAGNAYGLATATTFAALRAGVRTVHTSVGGAVVSGGSAMEETLMCAKRFLDLPNAPDTTSLAQDCEALLKTADIDVPLNKAVIGKDIFAHESGIHVDGVIKNPWLYEAIEPREVGLTRRLVIGKHSGRASIRMKLAEWGIDATEELTAHLTEQVRELAVSQRHALADIQLKHLYEDYISKTS